MTADFKLDTDVLVLGSGPAGFAAAYTAAKNKTPAHSFFMGAPMPKVKRHRGLWSGTSDICMIWLNSAIKRQAQIKRRNHFLYLLR